MAGWMDRTDPFVQLTLGEQSASTTVKSNAGGTADFNEVVFMNRAQQDSLLQVSPCLVFCWEGQIGTWMTGDDCSRLPGDSCVDDHVQVRVMDKDTFSNDELGRNNVDLKEAYLADRVQDSPKIQLPIFKDGEEKVKPEQHWH